MIKELKQKIAEKNKLVDFVQRGLINDIEFYRLLNEQKADILQDEQEIISFEEAHGAVCEEDGWEV